MLESAIAFITLYSDVNQGEGTTHQARYFHKGKKQESVFFYSYCVLNNNNQVSTDKSIYYGGPEGQNTTFHLFCEMLCFDPQGSSHAWSKTNRWPEEIVIACNSASKPQIAIFTLLFRLNKKYIMC